MSDKEYIIKNVPQTALYRIALTGGGEVPDTLKGKYTSPTNAHRAIASYNDTSVSQRKVASK